MKKYILFVFFLVLMSQLIFGCTGNKTKDIGLVTSSKTDEQAITEIVTAYYQSIYNFTWEKYDKTNGLEFWTEEAGKELLNNPSKLPNLEKSIKENRISRTYTNITINKITINGETANVEAIVQADSTSISPVFVGVLQSEEEITLIKVNKQWLISERFAQVGIIQQENISR